MNKFSQTSLVDYLIDIMPDIKNKLEKNVDDTSASILFNIWKEDGSSSNLVLRKPKSITAQEIDLLQKNGLVRAIGDKLQVTSKGANVIKTIILGDDSSALEKNSKNITYTKASVNVSTPSKLKRQSEKFNENWWSRF